METLLIAALVLIAMIVLGVFFVMKYAASRSGGNDDVWKPKDRDNSTPEG